MSSHARRRLTTLLVAAAVVAAASGCSVRDEPAATGGDDSWWTSSRMKPAGSGLIAGTPATPAAPPAIEFVDGIDAATRRAADAGLPMLVVFRATWCRWSSELAQAATSDPAIVRLSKRFICVAVDADRHADACRTFGVQAFPTVIILDADGTERFRATGSMAVAHVAAAMSDVAAAPIRPRRMAGAAAATSR